MPEKKFYQSTPAERLAILTQEHGISDTDQRRLRGEAGLTLDTANFMIENVVGTFTLPLGVARGFLVNQKTYDIPMVIEEPSVVAAASNAAKLVAKNNGFTAQAADPIMIGQIQLVGVPELPRAVKAISASRDDLLDQVRALNPVLVSAGGGPVELKTRIFDDSPIGPFLVVYLEMNVADAMGANAINSALEAIAPKLEALSGGEARLRILSNLADRRIANARCVLNPDTLATPGFNGEQVRDRILDAAALAEVDPYRAVTQNKGILNGIDAVVLATGNDWRAVEAGAHGYAARSGVYQTLTRWRKSPSGELVGEIDLPIAVGTVGGATRVHPTAGAALKLINPANSREFAGILAAVGLAQNLAALRALATVGIQKGHMALHARQVAIAAGAAGGQIERVAEKMRAAGSISIESAKEILSTL